MEEMESWEREALERELEAPHPSWLSARDALAWSAMGRSFFQVGVLFVLVGGAVWVGCKWAMKRLLNGGRAQMAQALLAGLGGAEEDVCQTRHVLTYTDQVDEDAAAEYHHRAGAERATEHPEGEAAP